MKRRIIAALTAAAALTSCFAMTGCSDKAEGGITEISWYIPTLLEGSEVSNVLTAVNEKLAEKYDLKLKLVCVDGGNYSQKLQVMNAGREEYDIAFTSNWTNDFQQNISNGCLYDITDDLAECAPETYAKMSEAEKKAVSRDGRIYAIPNWQIQAKSTALIFDKEKLDSTGMTLDDFNTLDDITTYLRKLHEVDPNCNVVGKFWASLLFKNGYEEILGEAMPPVIDFRADGKPIVINQYETQEFKSYVKLRDSWVKEGLITDQYDPDLKEGNKSVRRSPFGIHIYKPGLAEQNTKGNGYECVAKPFSDALISGAGINAALTAVSATSRHPKEALKMIEIMNTDEEIRNLLCWGIEGVNYKKTGENKVMVIDDSGYSRISDWILGSIRNAYQLDTTSETVIEETEEYNNAALSSPLLGLYIDVNAVATEAANCKTVINEQLENLERGLTGDVDAALDKFIKDLKAAGSDTIIEECQKQIDEWWSQNK